MPSTAVWMLRAEMRFRMVLSLVLLAGVLAMGVVGLALVASFVWPSTPDVAASVYNSPGSIDQFKIGEPVQITSGHYWLVRTSRTEVIAFNQKDPTWTCTVPWRPQFEFTDPATGQETRGWFRNPCSGATYALDGHCVSGPCNRGLDRRPVYIDHNGRITVDLENRRLIPGQPGVLGVRGYPAPPSGQFPIRGQYP